MSTIAPTPVESRYARVAHFQSADPGLTITDLDDRNLALIHEHTVAYWADPDPQPQEGDWVYETGSIVASLRRIAVTWDGGYQPSLGGSFHLGRNYASYSGAPEPGRTTAELKASVEVLNAPFWIFHHGSAQAHNALNIYVPRRCWQYAPKPVA